MKVATLRRVDRWLGVPACGLLTVARRFGDLRQRTFRRSQRPIERLLFVKLAEQGATVLAYAAIRRAVEMVGRQNVYFLVFAENRFILDVMDVVPTENVIAIPTEGPVATGAGLARAVARLRRVRPDAAVDLEFFARGSAAVTYLSGARVRVGLHRSGDPAPYRGNLMTHRVSYDPQRHTEDAFAAMVEAVTLPPGDVPPTLQASLPTDRSLPAFHPQLEESAEVRGLVQREAGTRHFQPLVLLNANASDLLPLRRWPPERYVALARCLLEYSPQVRIALTGAPAEAAATEQLSAAIGSPRCFSLAGKTSLRQLLTLYCLADVMVTNDSGPAHFATLTPMDVVTLFGPETPALFGARSPRSHIVYKNRPCSPCVNAYNNRLSTCKNNRCMQEITVEEVHAIVRRILGQRRRGGPE